MEIERAMGTTRVPGKDALFIKTSLEMTALVADYHVYVDPNAPTPMDIFKTHQGQSSSGKAGVIIYERYTEIIKRMSGTVATMREFFDFKRVLKLEKLAGAISQRVDSMLIPKTGEHGAVRYWLPAFQREIPDQKLLVDLYHHTYHMGPDNDQAIMFHGTNLDDLWRNACNGKISRAMPEGGENMRKRQNGAWCALGTLSLDYALWSFLAKGWMVRVVMIVDSRTTKPGAPSINKEKLLAKAKRPNQVLLTGRRGVPYHGIFVSFAREDYGWVSDEKAKNSLMVRTSMPYSGEMLSRFMRTCPASETFPYEAEALYWESVAGNTEIFTQNRRPIPAAWRPRARRPPW